MDFDELQSAIADLLDRDDIEAKTIQLWISLCEADMRRSIRHWRMEVRSRVESTEQYLSLPPGWLETIRLLVRDTQEPLQILSRQAMQENRERMYSKPDTPQFYRHATDRLELYPEPAEPVEIEMEYYAAVPTLGNDDYNTGAITTTNWILESHPDAYLYGTALHSAPWLVEDERLATWSSLYQTALARINGESDRAEMSSSSPRIKNFGLSNA